MDMITLAMAKAYTDEKVANGGASGGVCLPVVELSQETMTALFSGSNAMATEAEVAAFTAAKESIVPVIFKGNLGGAGFATVATFVTDGATGAQAFKADLSGIVITAVFKDNGVELVRG